MRRLLPLAIFLVLAAGCSTNKPGEKIVAPLPATVVGTVPKAAPTAAVPAEYKGGDATAGKQVFETAGCEGCHTLKDAGATGTVGPNLDQASRRSRCRSRAVTRRGHDAVLQGPALHKQIADVAAYVVKATGGNPNG